MGTSGPSRSGHHAGEEGEGGDELRRHFTATGYIVREDAVLLHWHDKLKMWLPPGGHIEPNEDPVQTVVREALEETGIEVRVLSTGQPFCFTEPRQLPTPVTILDEDIDDPVDGPHQHIDAIYFLVPIREAPEAPDGWRWFTREELDAAVAVAAPSGKQTPPPEDVRELGVVAIDTHRARIARAGD